MKKLHSRVLLLCGLISILATIILYLIVFDNIFIFPIRWVSLLCLLIVEGLVTVKAYKVRIGVWNESIITIAVLHLIVALVSSWLFINIFPLLVRQYILLNLFLIAITAIIDLIVFRISEKSSINNAKYSEASNRIDECLLKSRQLLLEVRDPDLQMEIGEIIESLTYSNRSGTSGNESSILEKIDMLHDMIHSDNYDDARRTMAEVKHELKLRVEQLKKRGKF